MHYFALSFETGHELNRLVEWINRYPEAVIEEFWDDPSQQRTADFKTRVRVALDQVDFELLVDHEVVAEDFEAVWRSVWVDLGSYGSERICDESFHLWEEVSHEMDVTSTMVLIEVTLEIVD